MTEQQDDVFNDSEVPVTEAPPQEEPKEPEQPGEKGEPTEPPSEGNEEVKAEKSEKMIPESRFKAALKDATEKLEAAQAELSQLKTTPAPDKEKDPEGYDLHVRMEASKAAMRATHDDYQQVIMHYAEMAKISPVLNEAVAKHPVPAQYAYQLAKEDMRLQKLSELDKSDDWKEFQEWKKSKTAKADEAESSVATKLSQGAPKVPNLNRAPSLSKEGARVQDDDELFSGAL